MRLYFIRHGDTAARLWLLLPAAAESDVEAIFLQKESTSGPVGSAYLADAPMSEDNWSLVCLAMTSTTSMTSMTIMTQHSFIKNTCFACAHPKRESRLYMLYSSYLGNPGPFLTQELRILDARSQLPSEDMPCQDRLHCAEDVSTLVRGFLEE